MIDSILTTIGVTTILALALTGAATISFIFWEGLKSVQKSFNIAEEDIHRNCGAPLMGDR